MQSAPASLLPLPKRARRVWPDRGTLGAAFARLPAWLLLIAALLAAPDGFAARPSPAGASPEAEPWSRERKARALNLGIVSGVVAYGALMWDWGEDTRFRTTDEGWFGADTRHGGADKLGHAYTGAVGTAIGAALYRRCGAAGTTTSRPIIRGRAGCSAFRCARGARRTRR